MFVCPQIDEKSLLVQHRVFEKALDLWSSLAVKTAEDHAKAHVKLYSKFKRRRSQGSLKDATLSRHRGTWRSRRLQIEVYVKERGYEQAIEYGSRSYTARGSTPIVARNARFLRFFWPKVGRVVFFRKVMHPGNKPYKFLYNATRSAYRVYGDAMSNSLDQAAKQF